MKKVKSNERCTSYLLLHPSVPIGPSGDVMIYLASVYSYKPEGVDPELMPSLMASRYEYARMKTGEYLRDKVTVFCPINHCHPIQQTIELPHTWDFWGYHDLHYLSLCTELWVLKMPHWEQSTGITAEIEFAEKSGIPVKYIECPDYSEEVF